MILRATKIFFLCLLMTFSFFDLVAAEEAVLVVNDTDEAMGIKLVPTGSSSSFFSREEETEPGYGAFLTKPLGKPRSDVDRLLEAANRDSIAVFNQLTFRRYYLKVRVGKQFGRNCDDCRYYRGEELEVSYSSTVQIVITSIGAGYTGRLFGHSSGTPFTPIPASEY